jgi:hypothetical protein
MIGVEYLVVGSRARLYTRRPRRPEGRGTDSPNFELLVSGPEIWMYHNR